MALRRAGVALNGFVSWWNVRVIRAKAILSRVTSSKDGSASVVAGASSGSVSLAPSRYATPRRSRSAVTGSPGGAAARAMATIVASPLPNTRRSALLADEHRRPHLSVQ